MQKRVHSRFALRTLLKLQRCGEGWIASVKTCWSPRSKTHERALPSRPPTIQLTVCSAASGRNDVVRHGVGKPKTYTPSLPAALKPPHQSVDSWQPATSNLCCRLERGFRFSDASAPSFCCRNGSASTSFQCRRILAASQPRITTAAQRTSGFLKELTRKSVWNPARRTTSRSAVVRRSRS